MDDSPVSNTNYVAYPKDVDFTKVGKDGSVGLHPRDARGQYVSDKLTSKRNKRLNWTQ